MNDGQPSRSQPTRLSPIDGLLVLMVIAWGMNYSLLKRAFEEIPPAAFNTLRMALASTVFLAAILVARRRAAGSASGLSAVFHTAHRVTARDRWDLVWLGLIGHCAYQLCFVGGLSRTTASNAALIFGTSPAVIAIASAAVGHERVGGLHWLGAALSAAGVYFVVGHSASVSGATVRGDLLVLLGVACWTVYTIGGSRLMSRHSPLFVTGATMAIGTVPYALLAIPAFRSVVWTEVSATAWLLIMPTGLLALNFAYLAWYVGVRVLGPARTSIYSNAIPLIAMITAATWLGEPITTVKIVGVAAILTGVALTRVPSRRR